MATYTITTTRKQEIGLGFDYDHYADKTLYPDRQSWFQHRIDTLVTDPMYVQQQAAQATAFDRSFNTVPEAEQPVAKTEIESVITAHGGTIVPAGPTIVPPPPVGPPPVAGDFGGDVSAPGGEGDNPVQAGAGDSETPPSS